MLIPLDYLVKKYNMHPKGVLHVGASTGQEAKDYQNAGIQYTFWVEPIKEIYDQLERHVRKFDFKSNYYCNALISDVNDDVVDFNIANNEGQSSSMFEFGTHTKMHPTVKFVKTIKLKTARIETIFDGLVNQRTKNIIDGEGEQDPFNPENFDFLNIDVQGAELKVLKSMGTYLENFKWAYIEVNKDFLYQDCPLVEEIDEYLKPFLFERMETKWTDWSWGDAFFLNTKLVSADYLKAMRK
jgi:FkbM family methyltransferase